MEAFIFLLYVVPFLLLVYGSFMLYIRPPKAVWLASLLGGLVMGVINIAVDLLAYTAHWWHYTFVQSGLHNPSDFQQHLSNLFMGSLNTLHIPLPFYLTPIFIYGSLGYLLIWRFWSGKARWFSWVLLIGIPLFSMYRDISGGITNGSYQVWENVPAATVATIVMWLVAFFLGFMLFWWRARKTPFVAPIEEGEANQVSTSKHAPTMSK
ncbi:hypothetical protein [Dictyobacter aurantiacus]|uniref:DUF2878 domain-containing protein n=1 Tax=Dictyobacter aurantiacus TaxID=1936993 RepID=A0A401ZC81_9CHLR|nr:hypothetical protein [Dictyobacter aurantiacus]GCE04328.1 hypothetical protein KDAU_16570 [Dictyobacter aurantiacus]